MKSLLRLLLGIALVTGLVYAQEATKPPAPPALKDAIALNLRTLQLSMSETRNQILQLQQREQQLATQYQIQMGTAIVDSGLDSAKYEIVPDGSLAVRAKVEDKAKEK